MNFSQPTPAIERGRYRAELAKMIADFQPTHFVTFVFNVAVTAHIAQADFARFRMWVVRKLTGVRSAVDQVDLPFIGAIEHESDNLHLHVLFRLSADLAAGFEQYAPHMWKRLRQAGNLDIKPVYDAMGAARYIVKELNPSEDHRLVL